MNKQYTQSITVGYVDQEGEGTVRFFRLGEAMIENNGVLKIFAFENNKNFAVCFAPGVWKWFKVVDVNSDEQQ